MGALSSDQEITRIFKESATDEELITALQAAQQRYTAYIPTILQARAVGHQKVDSSLEPDPFRQHALVDFYTGLMFDEAVETTARINRLIIMRRNPFSDGDSIEQQILGAFRAMW